MFVCVDRLSLNDDDPEIKFIEAEVIFKDDERKPHKSATLNIFLKKDDNMTTSEIKTAAVQKAREFLSFAANFPPNEYHRQWSFESVPEEVF